MNNLELRYIKSSHPLYKKWRSWVKLAHRADVLVCKEWQEDRLSFFSHAFDVGWYDGCLIYRPDTSKPYSESNFALVDKFAAGKKVNRQNAKLTNDDVKVIKKRLIEGYSQASLAQEYGVSRTAISMINLGKTWKHI